MTNREQQLADALTTEDLWRLMRRRVPPVVSEYFRGGADAETTLRGNVRAFQQSMTTAYGALSFDKLDMQMNTYSDVFDLLLNIFISHRLSMRVRSHMWLH